jgi:hypothetical protein
MLKIGNQYKRIAEADALIPNIETVKAQDALAFYHEIDRAVETNKQNKDYNENPYQIIPLVGTKQPTLQSAELANGQIIASFELPESVDKLLSDGDGTVPYASAIPIELSEEYRETYVPEKHPFLMSHPKVLDQLHNRLRSTQIKGLRELRGPEVITEEAMPSALSLTLEDLYLADEPIEIRARVVNFSNPEGLIAKIEPISGRSDSQTLEFSEQDHEWMLTTGGLSPGVYRLTVQTVNAGTGAPTPVKDLFQVGDS